MEIVICPNENIVGQVAAGVVAQVARRVGPSIVLGGGDGVVAAGAVPGVGAVGDGGRDRSVGGVRVRIGRVRGSAAGSPGVLCGRGAADRDRAPGVGSGTGAHPGPAATLNPARYLGLTGVGELGPGAWADAVVFGPDWSVEQVMYRGAWLAD